MCLTLCPNCPNSSSVTAEKRFDVFRRTESLLQIFGVYVADRWGRRTGVLGGVPLTQCPIVERSVTIWLLSIATKIEA